MATKRRSFTAIILSVLLFISSFALIFGNLQTKKAKASEQLFGPAEYLYYYSDNTSPLLTQTDIDSEYYNYFIRMYANAFTFETVLEACSATCEELFMGYNSSDNTVVQITEGELHDFYEVDSVTNTVIVFEMTVNMPDEGLVEEYIELFGNLRAMGFKIYLIASFEAADLEEGDSLISATDGFYQYYPEQYFFEFVVEDMVMNQEGLDHMRYLFDSRLVGTGSFETVYRTSSHLRCLFSLIRDELGGENDLPSEVVGNNHLEIYSHTSGAQPTLYNVFLGQAVGALSQLDPDFLFEKRFYAISYWYFSASFSTIHNDFLYLENYTGVWDLLVVTYLLQIDPIESSEGGFPACVYNRIEQNEAFYRAATKDTVMGQIEALFSD